MLRGGRQDLLVSQSCWLLDHCHFVRYLGTCDTFHKCLLSESISLSASLLDSR